MPNRRGPDKRRRVVSPLRAAVVREGASAARTGRPHAEIDWAKVEMPLSIGCTDEEVAAGVGVGTSTLRREPHVGIALVIGLDYLAEWAMRKHRATTGKDFE